jgi:hypothetical protein
MHLSPLNPIDPTTAWFLAAPAILALSELPDLTEEEQHARASRAWATIRGLGPMDVYRTMLAAHGLVLNEMLGQAARDVTIESRRGIIPGTESPMTTRAMSSYMGLHRALSQNVNTFARLTKDAEPVPERAVARRKPAPGKAETAEAAAGAAAKPVEPVSAAEPVAERARDDDAESQHSANAAPMVNAVADAAEVAGPVAAEPAAEALMKPAGDVPPAPAVDTSEPNLTEFY